MALEVFYLDDEKDLCDNFVDYFSLDVFKVTTFLNEELKNKK